MGWILWVREIEACDLELIYDLFHACIRHGVAYDEASTDVMCVFSGYTSILLSLTNRYRN